MQEIVAKMAELNKKSIDIDIKIFKNDDDIILALRDNSVDFSPMEYTPPENDPYRKADGTIVLKATAKEIRYDRVLALNQTVITISEKNSSKEG